MRRISHTLRVIEVEKHRGTLRDCAKKVPKFSHRVRSDRVAIVRRNEQPRLPLSREYAEMVLPEVHHLLVQLSIACDCAREPCRRHLRLRALQCTLNRWPRAGIREP